MMAQEKQVVDRKINEQIKKIKSTAGLFDIPR